jgi:hypothetical protein
MLYQKWSDFGARRLARPTYPSRHPMTATPNGVYLYVYNTEARKQVSLLLLCLIFQPSTFHQLSSEDNGEQKHGISCR